ncbi:hypothetical protein St11Ph5_00002 [Escherichia phage St11Ph5]|uniref:Uncharacterized protein n=1 Tax=Escherichia phage St11Ph5 TaxID=2047765 RepID=A0A2D2W399_9CAUD|nr:hypothetical protein PP767_gp02 [Escherichia phage St11Ph5]ATS92466.1 hypothetical protein St11Ph5_00002 [Escherichia phage St11Ph5]
MTKFRCIKGNCDIPVGTIIEGELKGEYIILTKDSTILMGEKPIFEKGEPVKLTGYVWQWEACEDKEELLERYEKAVRAHEMLGAQDPEDWSGIEEEYESAKAELLKRLS